MRHRGGSPNLKSKREHSEKANGVGLGSGWGQGAPPNEDIHDHKPHVFKTLIEANSTQSSKGPTDQACCVDRCVEWQVVAIAIQGQTKEGPARADKKAVAAFQGTGELTYR